MEGARERQQLKMKLNFKKGSTRVGELIRLSNFRKRDSSPR
jgi:hypothetical protein